MNSYVMFAFITSFVLLAAYAIVLSMRVHQVADKASRKIVDIASIERALENDRKKHNREDDKKNGRGDNS